MFNHKFFLLGVVSLIWGSQFFFSDLVLKALSPLTLAAGRSLIAAAALSVLLYFSSERHRRAEAAHIPTWKYAGIAFFDATVPLFLMAWGQTQLNSGLTAILMGTVPLFAALLTPLLLASRDRLTPGTWLSVAIGMISIVVLNASALTGGLGGASLAGTAAILGCAACFATGTVLIRRLGSPLIIRTTRNILLAAGLQLLPFALYFDRPWQAAWTPSVLGGLLFLGVISSGLAYLLFVTLINRAGASFASLSNYAIPMVGVALGVVFLGESVSVTNLAALALLLAALGASGWKGTRRSTTPPALAEAA